MASPNPTPAPQQVVQTPPPNAETYLGKIKKRATPIEMVIEDTNSMKVNQIRNLLLDVQLKQAEKSAKGMLGQDRDVSQAIANLFTNKSVEEIKEFLRDMTPEMLVNLQKLASSGADGPLIVREQPKSDISERILLHLLDKQSTQPSMGDMMKGIAELMKAMKDNNPPPSAPQGMSTMDTLKLVLDSQKPLYDKLSSAERAAQDARLRELEAKMPGSLGEQIEYVKEMAPMLGLGKNGTNELDLKLEEMRQNREVDMKKLDWEQRKYELESEADTNKWDQIGKILQGPVGDVVKSLGNAGADRVRGQRGNNNNSGKLKPVQTQCPQCSNSIWVDSEADTAVCGKCGAVLTKQGVEAGPQPIPQSKQQSPPQSTPASTHVEAEPVTRGVAEEQVETEDMIVDSNQPPSEAEETASEEEENGPSEAEQSEPEKQ